MSEIIKLLIDRDRGGQRRTFILSPHFQRDMEAGGASSAFNQDQSRRNLLHLALIVQVAGKEAVPQILGRGVLLKQLGIDTEIGVPNERDLDVFLKSDEWQAFLETSSLKTFQRLVGLIEDQPVSDSKIPEKLNTHNPDDLIPNLLSVNSGVALGDRHGEVANTEFLQVWLPEFQKCGVNTLYFEMIQSKDQSSLDEYMRTGAVEIIDEIMSEQWEHTPGMRQEYLDVLENARILGMRVIAIDKEEVGNRFHDSNPHWSKTILEDRLDRPESEKFVVFGGAYHFCKHPGGLQFPLMSVSQELGIPSVCLDAAEDYRMSVQRSISDHENDFQIKLPESPRQKRWSNGAGFDKGAKQSMYVDRADYRLPRLISRFEQDPSAYSKLELNI